VNIVVEELWEGIYTGIINRIILNTLNFKIMAFSSSMNPNTTIGSGVNRNYYKRPRPVKPIKISAPVGVKRPTKPKRPTQKQPTMPLYVTRQY